MNPFRTPGKASARIPVLPAAQGPLNEAATVAEMRLFDPIDSWGGEWGVSAKEFAAALDTIPKSVGEIRLMINSPGGEAFEAIAIANALRSHPAKVTAVVQGIAASSASFIAAAADELVMAKNSELFIHNGWNIAIGDAEVMRKMADDLDHLDRNIASFYADKAGDDIAHWLGVMGADTYMSAEQAVAAGLADRIEGVVDVANAKARFDLSVYERHEVEHHVHPSQHFGADPVPVAELRDFLGLPQTRSQVLPDSSEPGQPQPKEELDMSDAFMAGVRERLGVTDAEATEDAVLTALDGALAAKAEPKVPEGIVMIDRDVLASIKADGEAGRAALGELAKARREAKVEDAVRTGRISNANRDKWLARLERDEEGATEFLNELTPNAHPVHEIGNQVERDPLDAIAIKAGWADESEGEA